MFYLGIDIGKNTHVASLVDDKKKLFLKLFPFQIYWWCWKFNFKINTFQNELEVGMEATGHYWLSLYSYLVEKTLLFVLSTLSKLMVGDKVLRLEREKLILLILF